MKQLIAKLFRRQKAESQRSREHVVPDLTAATSTLLRDHHVATLRDAETIQLPEHGCRVIPMVFDENVHETGVTCCFDVQFELSDGSVIIETFAGIGSDAGDARRDAFENFVRSSFHVILRAVLLPMPDPQVDVEEWLVSGERFIATLGTVTARSPVSPEWKVPTGWFATLEDAIKQSRLPKRLCSIRFYYGHLSDTNDITEVLLNNEPWPEVAEAMKSFEWPRSDGFYSVRLFLILRPDPSPLR